MERKTFLITAALALVFAAVAGASLFLVPSNIDPVQKFSWSENAGWMNWADANGGADGVFVDTDFLSGNIWMENAGWVNVGNGGGPYANTDNTDFGVNILPGGNLEGYAWGENTGWINFDTASKAPDQARFDAGAGRFRGYAWGENIGWINLDDGAHFVGVPTAPDPAAIGNDLCAGGVNNGLPCSLNSQCPGGFCGLKNRYISVTPQNPGDQTVIQVTALTLPPAFAAFVGDIWYAGVPAPVNENPAPGPTMWTATLACNSGNLRDWGADGLVNITGAIIVPSATYEVRQCTAIGGACSTPLVVGTNKYGDIVAAFNAGQPNFLDVSAVVDKFKVAAGAPSKARTQLQPNVVNPNNNVNFLDISEVVNAFKGFPYPFPGAPCP